MLFVEDVLQVMAANMHNPAVYRLVWLNQPRSEWHTKFLTSVCRHVSHGRPLSVRQAEIVVILLARMRDALVDEQLADRDELDHLIQHPVYRQSLYHSPNIRREVGYLGDASLAFRFKYNDLIIDHLKQLGLPNHPAPHFERGSRVWVVPVGRNNLKQIRALIAEHRFAMTALADQFLTECATTRNRPASCQYDTESGFLLLNVVANSMLACWLRQVLHAAAI